MSIYVEVNGVQQRGLAGVRIGSVRVSQSLSNRNTAEVVLLVTNGATTYAEGQQVDIGNGSTRYFSGTIATMPRQWINPRTSPPMVQFTLNCVSFDQIASRRLVVTIPLIYTDKTAGEIVRDIATQFLGGENISLTGVEDGATTFSSFTVEPGTSVYEVFDSVAEKAGMYWDILGGLAQKDLRLYSRGSYPSAWSLSASSPIVTGGEGEAGITVTSDRQGLANEIYVQLAEGPGSPTTQDFLGNGTEREFTLDNPIDSHPTIRVNGIDKSVSLDGGIGSITAAWYYTPGSATIRQDSTQPILSGSDLLSVDYTPRQNVVVLGAKDDAAIAARAALEATSGRYQALISTSDGATVASANLAAAAYLAAHKVPSKQLIIRSFAAEAEALLIGQTIAVTLPALEVSGTFLVEAVTRDWKGKYASTGEDAILHAFTLSSGAVTGDWTTLFAGAWSATASAGATAGAAVNAGGSRVTVQDLGTLTADLASVTPAIAVPTAGDMLLVTWALASTVYHLTWGPDWTGTAKADYRPRTPSKHAYLFIHALDTWNLISWRTDY